MSNEVDSDLPRIQAPDAVIARLGDLAFHLENTLNAQFGMRDIRGMHEFVDRDIAEVSLPIDQVAQHLPVVAQALEFYTTHKQAYVDEINADIQRLREEQSRAEAED
ncbi:hypothetical protein LTR85_003430 [Meristemomyces frigidus]|nr:hypothetical protein LTR85_003430 [Meristemomyces frigidus]